MDKSTKNKRPLKFYIWAVLLSSCLLMLRHLRSNFSIPTNHHQESDIISQQPQLSTRAKTKAAIIPLQGNNNNNDNNNKNKDSTGGRGVVIPGDPYRIVQWGSHRTGSTFQYQLLKGIVALKVGNDRPLYSGFLRTGSGEVKPGSGFGLIHQGPAGLDQSRIFNLGYEMLQYGLDSNESFVFKSHALNWKGHLPKLNILKLAEDGIISLITSGGNRTRAHPYAYYSQGELRGSCAECQIRDHYQSLFQLSDQQVRDLERHAQLFTAIRQCCGIQMSKYQVLNLRDCNMTRHIDKPGYPHCDRYNLTAIEEEYDRSPVPHYPNEPHINWDKPGDCEKFSNVYRRKRVPKTATHEEREKMCLLPEEKPKRKRKNKINEEEEKPKRKKKKKVRGE